MKIFYKVGSIAYIEFGLDSVVGGVSAVLRASSRENDTNITQVWLIQSYHQSSGDIKCRIHRLENIPKRGGGSHIRQNRCALLKIWHRRVAGNDIDNGDLVLTGYLNRYGGLCVERAGGTGTGNGMIGRDDDELGWRIGTASEKPANEQADGGDNDRALPFDWLE